MTINYNVENDIKKLVDKQLESFNRSSKVSVIYTNSGWYSIKIGSKLYTKVEFTCEINYELDELESRGFNVSNARKQALQF